MVQNFKLIFVVFAMIQFEGGVTAVPVFEKILDSNDDNSIPAEPLNPSEFEESKLIVPGQNQKDPDFYKNEVRYRKSFQEATQRKEQITRNGLVDERKRWPKIGEYVQIPYIITSKFTPQHRQQIAKAFENFHATTCIRFIPRSTQIDYVSMVNGSGCDSEAGRIGGVQQLTLGPGCESTDTAIHELNHAVGFWHEQNRPDRDNYVKVYLNNVKPENRFNFDKMSARQINAFGVEYDTDSIMHYDKWAFSRDPEKLIVLEPRKPNENMGKAKVLSKSDSLRINRMYKCNGGSQKKKYPGKIFRFADVTSEEILDKRLDFYHSNNCQDFHEDCTEFHSMTNCDENAWFKVTCRKTCNTCGNPCQDMKAECSTWAANGACADHFEYMNLYCPESCQVCQSNQPK